MSNAVAQDLDQRIRSIMADILEVDADAITPSTVQGDLPQWDSLNHLQLVVALEEEFGFTLAMNEVSEITSFARIRDVVMARA